MKIKFKIKVRSNFKFNYSITYYFGPGIPLTHYTTIEQHSFGEDNTFLKFIMLKKETTKMIRHISRIYNIYRKM